MKCILMNKNTEVLLAEYNILSKEFSKIYEVKNINYAPLMLKQAYNEESDEKLLEALVEWFKSRKIPSFREDLDSLLVKFDINTSEELSDKAFGLSLSDQYWIRPVNNKTKYSEINFFENDFDSENFLNANFSKSTDKITDKTALRTPNNTTDGILKKAWIIENKKRYLLKSGFKKEILQPFNEVLASMICDSLGFDHVPYILDIVENRVVSKCECFINKDTEFINAYQVMYGLPKHNSVEDYEQYIKILEKHKIKNAREKVENMYILDYLIMNDDRHLYNFGIIRDVNTLEWLDVAPIFDSGQALNIVSYNPDGVMITGEGRLFYVDEDFENIIKIVRNIKRIDLSKLDGVVEKFSELLKKCKDVISISDYRINNLCDLLNKRINKLKKIIDDSK